MPSTMVGSVCLRMLTMDVERALIQSCAVGTRVNCQQREQVLFDLPSRHGPGPIRSATWKRCRRHEGPVIRHERRTRPMHEGIVAPGVDSRPGRVEQLSAVVKVTDAESVSVRYDKSGHPNPSRYGAAA